MVEPRRLLGVAAVAGVALLPPAALALDQPYALDLVARMMILALAAVSLDLVLGLGGMVSFGHAAYFGLGAYVVAILAHHAEEGAALIAWPVAIAGTYSALLAWPAAVALAALFALFVGLLSLRTGGVYFIMITLAFAQMAYFFFVGLDAYGGDDGLTLWARSTLGPLDLENEVVFYYLVAAILGLAVGLGRRLRAARFGAVLAGIRENERRMRALGYPTFRYKLVAFVIAGGLAGLAGALMANQSEFVSPSFLHWTRSGELLIMVVLGGMGSIYGAVVGAFALLMLEEALAAYVPHWQVLFGLALVIVVLRAPGGLAGLVAGRRD